jgi:hypothetical protein
MCVLDLMRCIALHFLTTPSGIIRRLAPWDEIANSWLIQVGGRAFVNTPEFLDLDQCFHDEKSLNDVRKAQKRRANYCRS